MIDPKRTPIGQRAYDEGFTDGLNHGRAQGKHDAIAFVISQLNNLIDRLAALRTLKPRSKE